MRDAIAAFTADEADEIHAKNCGTETASSEHSSPANMPQVSPSQSEPPKHWSSDQNFILRKISAYITALRRCFPAPNHKKRLPDPLRLFVCGGPGTGKSTVISQAAQLFQESDIQIKCGAPTGVAAGSMRIPCATTIHTGWKIPRQGSEDGGATREQNESLPFHRKHLDRLKTVFHQSINSGIPFATFLDEVLPALLVQSCLVQPSNVLLSGVYAFMHFSGTHFSTKCSNPTKSAASLHPHWRSLPDSSHWFHSFLRDPHTPLCREQAAL